MPAAGPCTKTPEELAAEDAGGLATGGGVAAATGGGFATATGGGFATDTGGGFAGGAGCCHEADDEAGETGGRALTSPTGTGPGGRGFGRAGFSLAAAAIFATRTLGSTVAFALGGPGTGFTTGALGTV